MTAQERNFKEEKTREKRSAKKRVADEKKKVVDPQPIEKIYSDFLPSGKTRYRVYLGKNRQGKRVRPSLGPSKRFAVEFREQWNSSIEEKDTVNLEVLEDVSRFDIRWAMIELGKVNRSLREAVEFYLAHALPEGDFLNFDEAMDKYYELQSAKNLSPSSCDKSHSNYVTYYRPLVDFFEKKPLIDITRGDLEKYFDLRGKNWGPAHFNSHVGYGRRFWNLLSKQKYCSMDLNPWETFELQKITAIRGTQKILNPWQVRSFFWFVEEMAKKDYTMYQELALMALTFFCGVRIEEIEKCGWSQIQKNVSDENDSSNDKSNWRITVFADQEKTSKTKVNPIPKVAQYWLLEAEKNKTREKICRNDWKQKMKRTRKAFFEYQSERAEKYRVPPNCGRHSFCSYHIAKYGSYELTVQRMKHGSASTLRKWYEAVVTPEEGEQYFSIVVPRLVFEREREKTIEAGVKYAKKFGLTPEEFRWWIRLQNHTKKLFIKYMDEEFSVSEIEVVECIDEGKSVRVDGKEYGIDEKKLRSLFDRWKDAGDLKKTFTRGSLKNQKIPMDFFLG